MRFDAVVGADGLWSQVRARGRAPRSAGLSGLRGLAGHARPRATRRRASPPTRPGSGSAGRPCGPLPDRRRPARQHRGDRARREPVEGWSAPGDRALILAALRGRRAGFARPPRGARALAPVVPLRPPGDAPWRAGGSRSSAMPPIRSCRSWRRARRWRSRTRRCSAKRLRAEDVPGSLQAYAERRGPRVRRVQAEARRNGWVYHAGGAVALGRDTRDARPRAAAHDPALRLALRLPALRPDACAARPRLTVRRQRTWRNR